MGNVQCIGTPTVFARVSEEIAWINSYIDLWSGGGGGGPNPTPTPPSPTPPGTCTNDPNFIDSFGDDCSWYEENDPDCSFGDCCDIGNGTANTACYLWGWHYWTGCSRDSCSCNSSARDSCSCNSSARDFCSCNVAHSWFWIIAGCN